MSTEIPRWDGSQVHGALSRGSGAFSAYDWRQLVLSNMDGDIQRKANEKNNGKLAAYPESEKEALTKMLGSYSYVQSINSEDTITWSVFQEPLVPWILEIINLAFPGRMHPAEWTATFWERQSLNRSDQRGIRPEADVVLRASGWEYGVECKWKKDLGNKQGRQKDKTQLDMRAYAVEEGGAAVNRRGVIVIVPGPDRYKYAKMPRSIFSRYFFVEGDHYASKDLAEELNAVAITWEQVLTALRRDVQTQDTADYLEWRLRLSFDQG